MFDDRTNMNDSYLVGWNTCKPNIVVNLLATECNALVNVLNALYSCNISL